jgi:polysaccharide pyruvyl transferase WcaK-like protein
MNEFFKIIIYGSYGKGNFGDDLLMISVIRLLSKKIPISHLSVTAHPKQAYIQKWFSTINTIDVFKPKKRNVDLFIFGGGTQMFHFQEQKKSGVLNLIKKMYRFSISLYYARESDGTFKAIRYNRSLAISIGIGPFIKGSKIKQKTIKWLKDCAWIGLRDNVALEFCNVNNINNTNLYSDLIFNKCLWSNELKNPNHNSTCLKNISIVIRDWNYDTDSKGYIVKLLDASKQLQKMGYKIKFISFAETIDSDSILKIKKSCFHIRSWQPEKMTVNNFIDDVFRGVDLVVSARAHGLIVASSLEIPSFAIEIEPKLKIINMQINGCSPIWSPPFLPSDFVSIILKLSSRWEKVRGAMVKNSGKLARKATKMANEFIENV